MKIRRLIGSLLALVILGTAAGCGSELELVEPEQELLDHMAIVRRTEWGLPEGTMALELVDIGKNRDGFYIDCLPYDEDVYQLSAECVRLPLAENVTVFFYPLNMPGSSGLDFGGAESFYSRYEEEQMQGVMFWDYEFDESGALQYLSDEIPRELIVEDRPVEDFYGCWDYSESFWQPGLEMYNVPGEPPCGDYIVLYEDWTAEVYKMEENTVYYVTWEMWDSSAYVEALDIFLSFTDCGLEDSNGHYAEPGTPPSADGMKWVDLT